PSLESNAAPIDPLPVAVIGCGRMGRLHARVYSKMPTVKLVGVHDADADTAAATADEFGCRTFARIEDLLPHVKAVTIAVPTNRHADVAELCLGHGVACLVEKPLAKDVMDARRIAEAARGSGATVQVGHIERFNPAIQAMRRLGIKPRLMEVIRI